MDPTRLSVRGGGSEATSTPSSVRGGWRTMDRRLPSVRDVVPSTSSTAFLGRVGTRRRQRNSSTRVPARRGGSGQSVDPTASLSGPPSPR